MNMKTSYSDGCELLATEQPDDDPLFLALVRPLLEADLPGALAGRSEAVVGYVVAWRSSRQRLLSYVLESCPGLKVPPLLEEALDTQALQAPFSAWTACYGPQHGPALDLLARLRSLLESGARPLSPPLPPEGLPALWQSFDPAVTRRFYRAAHAALEGRSTQAAQIMNAFGLNKTELGRLFGVTRQAVDQWLDGEVPADRRAKAAVVLATIDLLEPRIKRGRLPGIARRKADAYGGRSMLEMIEADEHERLLELTRRSFDYAATA
jgi:hypothetical protein